MFDANMRYIPQGRKFIAEVRGSLPEDHPLANRGTRVFLCTMMTKGHKNPSVEFQDTLGTQTLSSDKSGSWAWIVYAGKPDGTDFIHEDVKKEAMELLEKLNETCN